MSAPGAPGRTPLTGAALIAALIAISVWIVFLVVMVVSADIGETQWIRLTYVFASVEALAFAAAGALFGVSVQRDRVEKAEEKAEANARDAEQGRALAAAVIADGHDAGIEGGLESLRDDVGAGDVRRRHAETARRLFPDLDVP